MFPVTHEVPEGAETVTYYGYEKRGLATVSYTHLDVYKRQDSEGY